MANKKATGMVLDGVFASEAIDSSGEVLCIEGCDISSLVGSVANWEHKQGSKEAPGTGNNGEEIVGRILYAKKLFKLSDCENDRQRMYWNKVNLPMIYGMVRLYDGAGHSGAQAIAAMARDHHANNEPLNCRWSIEGSTLHREGNELKESCARKVAVTISPCNRTAFSGIISDANAPDGFDKEPVKQTPDLLAQIAEDTKKFEFEHPNFTRLGGSVELEYSPLFEPDTSEKEIKKSLKALLKAKVLKKTLTAGGYNSAPGSLTGGSALQVEHLKKVKSKAMAALRDYDAPVFRKDEFKTYLKSCLPEADDSFIDHFTDAADDFKVKLKKKEHVRPFEYFLPPAGIKLARSIESLKIDLRKALDEKKKTEAEPEPTCVQFNGQKVQPGNAETAKGLMHLLGESATHYTAIPQGKLKGWDMDDMVTLPKSKENTHFRVHSRPHVLVADLKE